MSIQSRQNARLYTQRVVQTLVYTTLFMPLLAVSAGCSVWVFNKLAGL